MHKAPHQSVHEHWSWCTSSRGGHQCHIPPLAVFAEDKQPRGLVQTADEGCLPSTSLQL